MRILLTGATGFTARHLIARLRREPGAFIAGCDIAPTAPSNTLDAYTQCDIGDAKQVAQLVESTKPDWIFHLAGLFRGAAPEVYRVNLIGSVNLLEAVKTISPNAALLMVGSAAEYGIWPASEMPLKESHACRPIGAYGLSKYAGTLTALDYAASKVKIVVARPFNLIGPGVPPSLVAGAIIQRAKTAVAKGASTITMGNVDSERDFVAIEDAVDGYVKLLQAAKWGEIFNICSGEPCSIRSLVETVLSFAPRPMTFVEDTTLLRANDNPISIGDASKARSLAGFKAATPLKSALRSAWDAA